jgi:hypothetical protein
VAADRERVLGAEHDDTLISQYNHAHYLNLTLPSEAAALLAVDVLTRADRALGGKAVTTRACRRLVLAVLAHDHPVRAAVMGEAPQLWFATDALLRFDSGFATEVLAALCVATSWIDRRQIPDAVRRVAQRAVRAGRAPELGAAVMRTLLGMGADRRAPWISEWLQVSKEGDEHAVLHRMLVATSDAFADDPTALLKLPLEEKRIVRQIIAPPDGTDPWGD